MNKKVIFLDIDGTLVGDDGYVPATAKEACIKARENGHKIFLCTGRSKPEIYDFIYEIGFDGTIGAGGGFVEIEEEMLYHKKVSKEAVKGMVDFFDENEVDFYIESNGGLYASKNLKPHLERCVYGDLEKDEEARLRKETKPNPFIDALIYGEKNLYRDDINKVCFLASKNIHFDKIKKEFENEFEVIQCTVPAFGDDSGELAVKGVHKAIAIEDLLNHLNIDTKNTIAIGDGLNDIEMFEYCNIGIAMGNAKDKLKEIADYVTDDVDKDGLYKAFKHFELIN
jgi:Cof subfamily protein (haloacid dehalogenase superfamily)